MAKVRRPRPVQRRWDRRSANAKIFHSNSKALPKSNTSEGRPIDQLYAERDRIWSNVFARINMDAPVPSYEIDRIVLDYSARKLLPFERQVVDELKNTGLLPAKADAVWLVRMVVVTSSYCGLYFVEAQSKKTERLKLTRAHFEDLRVIKALIRRDGLERVMIRWRDGGDGNEIRELFKAFEEIDVAIDNYLNAYEPKETKGGNHDYLSSALIRGILEVWHSFTTCREVGSRDDLIASFKKDMSLLTRLLAAAWRDLKFPIEDGHGNMREPLEEWFRNRLLREFEYDRRRPGNLPSE